MESSHYIPIYQVRDGKVIERPFNDFRAILVSDLSNYREIVKIFCACATLYFLYVCSRTSCCVRTSWSSSSHQISTVRHMLAIALGGYYHQWLIFYLLYVTFSRKAVIWSLYGNMTISPPNFFNSRPIWSGCAYSIQYPAGRLCWTMEKRSARELIDTRLVYL